MSGVFADSFYFFAMINPRDARHAEASKWTREFHGRLVTTEWVMLEVADGLASWPGRASFSRMRQAVLENADQLLVPLDVALYGEGLELFNARSDKHWSLTDCISFVVMDREGLTDALTADRHFEQAGFRALFYASFP